MNNAEPVNREPGLSQQSPQRAPPESEKFWSFIWLYLPFSPPGRAALLISIIYMFIYTYIGPLVSPPPTRFVFNFPNAQVLTHREDFSSNVTHFRLAVHQDIDGWAVKYVSVDFDVRMLGEKIPKTNTYNIWIPAVPQGDNCTFRFGVDPGNDGIALKQIVSCQALPSVNNAWNSDAFEYLHLEPRPMKNSTGNVRLVRHPKLDTPGGLAVMKFANFADEIHAIALETEVYYYLQNSGIAPKFLGHVREGRRVIGFLLEYIEDARLTSEIYGLTDAEISRCQQALAKLHGFGLIHNDIHLGNCLIRRDGTAILIDFDRATFLSLAIPDVLNQEYFARDFVNMTNTDGKSSQ
ncbi:hypothetical protein NUW58_g5318 [Xylaria curta]|uniref:Uncharacterized protein n=1 Tax=Xylaria curta TaxID=42375 RepID=A0ACC1P3A6_9PEZI|nr:hypothetical protein NUW58_g5318 [Xylaria curta]